MIDPAWQLRHPELFSQARERLCTEWKHSADCINDEVIVE